MGEAFVARDIEFYHCPACDEKVYDREAMRKIESFHPARKAVASHKAS